MTPNTAATQAQANELKLNITGNVLKILQYTASKDEDGHSLGYVAEEMIVLGCKARENSRKSAHKARNARLFSEELGRNPSIAANPEAMRKLMDKYEIVPDEQATAKNGTV